MASIEITLRTPLGVGFSSLPTVAGKKATSSELAKALTVWEVLSTSTRVTTGFVFLATRFATEIVWPASSNFLPGFSAARSASLM